MNRSTIRVFALIAAAVGLVACESATAPDASVQQGFGEGDSGQLGPVRLVLSQHIAQGLTVDPMVEDLATTPDDQTARAASRFRSSNGHVLSVNPDGTLTARDTGTSVVTVDADGSYDSLRVDVVEGWQPTFHPTADRVSGLAVNDDGVITGIENSQGVVITNGNETLIGACMPTAINNSGVVACNLPTGACEGEPLCGYTPALYVNGAVTPLLPGSHGIVGAINDSGTVLGFVTDIPNDSYEYFIGQPGALQVSAPVELLIHPVPAVAGLNNAGIGVLSLTDPRTFTSANGLEALAVATGGNIVLAGANVGATDINDVNDIVGSSSGPAAWYGVDMPAVGSGVSWPYHGIGDGRCNPVAITDRNQIFGQVVPGLPCLYETGGVFEVPSQMVSAQAGWTMSWDNFAVSRNGTLAVPAQSSTGQQGVAVIKT